MEYSENLLRGLSTSDWISDGLVSMAAFQFKFAEPYVKNGWATLSVCWEDDDSVTNMMLQQKKDDRFQFRAGIARLKRESIDDINKRAAFRTLNRVVSYEREPLEDNLYHGNLLANTKSSKTQMTLLRANLASEATPIPRNQEF